MKQCSRCGAEKPLEAFHRFRRSCDGRMAMCADCDNARVRQYQADNPEASKQRNAEWRAENHEHHLANNRKWRLANAEQHRANARQWAINNSASYRARLQTWRAQNPDKVAAYRANNREAYAKHAQRRRAALGRSDPSTSAYVDVLRGDPCCYCGSRLALQVDHIEPVVRGGDGDWVNLTSACRSCNSAKNAEPLLLWLAALPA
jgi:5-methylcytosine-specific restriction endonuclease McrA